MRRWIEGLETFAIDVILERRAGKRAGILRFFLAGLAKIYRAIVQTRLALYRHRIFRSHSHGVLVISVGNLTVGGTGKTPVVEMLARALQQGGRRVAILSRGYKSVPKPLFLRLIERFTRRKKVFTPRVVSDGVSLLLDSRTAGDEPFMLANNLRGVVVLVDRDRVRSGIHAIEEFGSDVLILDDGFQYVKMRHGLEITLIDRQAPFGNEHMLPRGTLREPPENLRRATHIFLTKCDGSDNSEIIRRIRSRPSASASRCGRQVWMVSSATFTDTDAPGDAPSSAAMERSDDANTSVPKYKAPRSAFLIACTRIPASTSRQCSDRALG